MKTKFFCIKLVHYKNKIFNENQVKIETGKITKLKPCKPKNKTAKPELTNPIPTYRMSNQWPKNPNANPELIAIKNY